MKASDINTLKQAQRYVEGCINDFEAGISTKDETIKYLGEYTLRLMEIFEKNSKIKPSITVVDYAKEKLAITQKIMDEDDHVSNMHSEFLSGTYNAYDDIIFAIENNQLTTKNNKL